MIAATMNHWKRRLISTALLIVLVTLLSSVYVYAWIGNGFVSLQSISQVANSILNISDGSNSEISIGMSPMIIQMPVTSIYTDATGTHATLQVGIDMNGMPTASVWFELGLTAAYGSFTTNQTITSSGLVGSGIPLNLNHNTLYHFRVVAESDGIMYGSDQTFITATEQSKNFALYIIPVIIALMGGLAVFWAVDDEGDVQKTVLKMIFMGVITVALFYFAMVIINLVPG